MYFSTEWNSYSHINIFLDFFIASQSIGFAFSVKDTVCVILLLIFARPSYFIMHIIFAFFVADFVSRVDLRGIKMHLGRRPAMFQKRYCPLSLSHIAPPGFDCCNQSQRQRN